MRISLVATACVLLASTIANAQTDRSLTNARLTLVPALQTLGFQQTSTISIAGTSVQNGNVTPIASSWAISRLPLPSGELSTRIEYFRRVGPQLHERIVADGERLWFYNYIKHEYSVFKYKKGNSDQTNRALYLALRKRIIGYDNIILHTLLDAEKASTQGTAQLIGPQGWNPFTTNPQITTSPTGVETVSTTPRYTYIKYNVSFDVNTGKSFLQSMRGYQEIREAKGTIVQDWTATVWENAFPPSTSFAFDPGTAKPVSINLPQGG